MDETGVVELKLSDVQIKRIIDGAFKLNQKEARQGLSRAAAVYVLYLCHRTIREPRRKNLKKKTINMEDVYQAIKAIGFSELLKMVDEKFMKTINENQNETQEEDLNNAETMENNLVQKQVQSTINFEVYEGVFNEVELEEDVDIFIEESDILVEKLNEVQEEKKTQNDADIFMDESDILAELGIEMQEETTTIKELSKIQKYSINLNEEGDFPEENEDFEDFFVDSNSSENSQLSRHSSS